MHERTFFRDETSSIKNKIGINPHNLVYKSSCRLPTEFGEFTMYCFEDSEEKIHHVLLMGKLTEEDRCLVRIHSKCCTGDVFASIRCDCRFQLLESMKRIGQKKKGLLIYLDQEGRGIGIVSKLKAYALQDKGYDTYQANLLLGYKDDSRNYNVVINILKYFKLKNLSVLTNNPEKISFLNECGTFFDVERIALEKRNLSQEQKIYLASKVQYKNHLLNLNGAEENIKKDKIVFNLTREISCFKIKSRPFVTLSFAQTLDGSIAHQDYRRAYISNDKSMALTHKLRACHDGILVGVSTVLHDNPFLSARGKGPLKQANPIILDSHLKTPIKSNFLSRDVKVIFITSEHVDPKKKQEILKVNEKAQFISVKHDPKNKLCLEETLLKLREIGIFSLMVEGGASVIKSFIIHKLIDHCIITISPQYIGGLDYRDEKGQFVLDEQQSFNYDGDVIITGNPS